MTPVSVLGAVKTFCNITAGGSGIGYSLAIDKNGRAWAWGGNGTGQLGDNTTTSRLTPVSVLGAVKTFCQIAAGDATSLAIDKNGRVWAWGSNGNGQLGDNTTTSRLTPVSVLGAVKTFCQIAAGSLHCLAIDKNGRAWAWGSNSNGQLGDNSTTQRLTPVSVLGAVKTFCQIVAGFGPNVLSSGSVSSLAIDKNGRVWAWGSNSNGQLGDNTTTNRLTPVSVLGAVKTFCKITTIGFPNDFAIQRSYSLAIDKNGRAWAWGSNTSGVLGDGTITQRLTPVSVAGVAKTFCEIMAGGDHSIAIDKNGRAWAWGIISSGRLGINKNTFETTPVQICNI